MQERLERFSKSVEYSNLESVEGSYEEDKLDENSRISQSNLRNSVPNNMEGDSNHLKQMVNEELHTNKQLLKTFSRITDDRNFRSDADDTETEDAAISRQEDITDLHEILEWAKGGSTLIFHPPEHLHPLEYHRVDDNALYLSGSAVDLKSGNTNLELVEAQNSLLVAEEATALSIWAVACLCGTLRLEHVQLPLRGSAARAQRTASWPSTCSDQQLRSVAPSAEN
ncbi:hypothetical protein L195_g019345 [Trifolium pratense]|uniref:Uncharacterized protein n=1 Tax=Trifolium pratense TaxID=57577 RepID=A0A2K3MZB4_TRIPR|nr:hypothetical protein L195_g019345 [Trifolium pratense]